MKTVANALFKLADIHSDKVCFAQEAEHLTFRSLAHRAMQVAYAIERCSIETCAIQTPAIQKKGIHKQGIQVSGRVALLSKDCLSCYEIFFGCALSQTVLVGINWRLQANEIRYILDHSEAEILFVSSEFYPLIQSLRDQLPQLKWVILLDDLSPSSDISNKGLMPYRSWTNQCITDELQHRFKTTQYDEQAALVQMYTSGTTGQPKGVVLAHYTFFHLLDGMRSAGDDWMDLNEADTLLLSLPIFHIGGLWWAVQGFLAGAKGVIMPTFSGELALRLMRDEQVTKAALVPAMMQFVLAEPDCQSEDFTHLRGVLYGASPISASLLHQAISTFACDFFQIYGMTETGNMAVCLRPEDHQAENRDRCNATGKALPSVELKVIDASGNELPCGEIGEILIKSPSRMLGYWKNPEATTQTLQDGWIYSGDAGYLDNDGYLYVCDRIKDMIIYAGENIYPAEIEALIHSHPKVKEVAVIGVPDPRWGERVKAIVALEPNATLKKRDILDFIKGQIADFKLPKVIEFIDVLPRNAAGKVLKRQLRDTHWQGQDRQIN